MCVHLRVCHLLRRERALPPVRALHALVADDIELLLQYLRKTHALASQDAGGQLRVVNPVQAKVEIALKRQYIVLSRMKNYLGCVVFKNLAQLGQLAQLQRIDQIVHDSVRPCRPVAHHHAVRFGSSGPRRRRYLDQTYPRRIAEEAVALRIQRHPGLTFKMLQEQVIL